MYKPDQKGSETLGCLAQLSPQIFQLNPQQLISLDTWHMLLQKSSQSIHSLSSPGLRHCDPEDEALHSLFQYEVLKIITETGRCFVYKRSSEWNINYSVLVV